MCNGWTNFIKCGSIVLIAGIAICAFFCCKAKEDRKDKSMKRKAKRALSKMEDVMYDVQDIFKKH